MSLFKTAFTSAAMLAGGLFAMAPDTSDAQIRFQIGGGHGGYGHGGYQGHGGHGYGGSGFRYGGHGGQYDGFSGGHRYNSGYGGHGGHYNYRPTTVTPYRGHYGVQSGHYDYNGGGHYGH